MTIEIRPTLVVGEINLFPDEYIKICYSRNYDERTISVFDPEKGPHSTEPDLKLTKEYQLNVEQIDKVIKILQDAKRFLEGKRSKWVKF